VYGVALQCVALGDTVLNWSQIV